MKRIAALAFIFVSACSSYAIFPDLGVDTNYQFVGQVGDVGFTNGSGTVIAPHYVLTAKHVGGSRFYFRHDGQNIDGFVDAVERINHPTADISILRFNEDLGSYARPFYADEIGQDVTMVGFGITATLRGDGTGYNMGGGAGIRRAANNVADLRLDVDLGSSSPHSISLLYDLDAPTGNGTLGGTAVANEGGVLFGDSGGAWLRNIGGSWRIVGVNSFIGDNTGNENPNDPNTLLDFGDVGGAVDLNEFSEWIDQNAPVPEPTTVLALGFGMVALLKRRSQKKS